MMASEQHEWADDFGLMIPSVNARLADEEEVVDQVDDIQDVIDDFDSYFQQIDNSSNPTQSEVEAFQDTASDLNTRLNAFSNDTMRANAGLGLGLAIPSSSVSFGIFTNGNLTATVRGELDKDDSALLESIATAADANDLQTIINNAETDSDGNLKLDSRGKVLASAVIEAGVSLATTLNLDNENALQIGVSPKYVQLRTYQYTETVSGFEDEDFDSDEYQTQKSGFNMDIGAAYAFGQDNQWNTGIMVRNIIPMELDSARAKPGLEEKRTLELNPMVTAGISHKSDYHVLTAEVDLTKKEAFGYEDDTQWVALGAELDAWHWAQLRAGVRHNLASNDDNNGIEEDTQFTAGVGLNIIGIRIDVGGLYSSADVGAAIELGSAF